MKKLVYLVIFVIFLSGVGYFGFNYWYSNGIDKRISTSEEKVAFEVSKGESSDSIATNLVEAGLIDDEMLFKLYLKRTGKAANIQAGNFEIPKNANIVEIVEILGKATIIETVKVTIIEGYRNTKVQDVLAQKFGSVPDTNFSVSEFESMTKNPDDYQFSANIQTFLDQYKPKGKSLEGFLYPDTYEFKTTASTKEVVEKMLTNFINKTKSLEKGEDFYDKLVLAAIIERESFTNEERPIIASVFYNRLKAGWKLESDATVNYATGSDNPRPTYKELETNSPYNTYKFVGLPPTPINNPRVQSIEAAINPATTEYYFFIHEQDGSGQVHFARTLAEHNANVAKYLD